MILKLKTKGQSLVEVAIVLPLLIFMMIGVLEVGYVLRNYFSLLNASREGARFAIRPGYINPEGFDFYSIGLDKVISQIKGSTNLEPEKVESIITYLGVDTGNAIYVEDNGSPCDFEDSDWASRCTCLLNNPFNIKSFSYTFPFSSTVVTTQNISELSSQLAEANIKHNCELVKKGALPTVNNVIIVETFYEHFQLFGFPIISNPYTNPIELHASTVMRVLVTRQNPYGN